MRNSQYESLLDGEDVVDIRSGTAEKTMVRGQILSPKIYYAGLRRNSPYDNKAIEVLVPMTFIFPCEKKWVYRVQKLMEFLSERENIPLPAEFSGPSVLSNQNRCITMRIEHGLSLLGSAPTSLFPMNPATFLVQTVGVRSIGLFTTPVNNEPIYFNEHPRDIVIKIAGKSVDMLPEETPDQWGREKQALVALSILSNERER